MTSFTSAKTEERTSSVFIETSTYPIINKVSTNTEHSTAPLDEEMLTSRLYYPSAAASSNNSALQFLLSTTIIIGILVVM